MIHSIRTVLPSFPPDPGQERSQIGQYWVEWSGVEPTLAQVQAILTPPTKRPLLAIAQDLNALSTAKKNAIWSDITSGTPPKWATDAGPNAAAIAVLQLLATTASLSAADMLSAKIRAVAMYVQDVPAYLVNPAFDPTINVSGVA